MDGMTKQQIFNKVATHLFAQSHPAKKGEVCMYLAPNGDRCAVGCLMEADDYDPKYENHSAYEITKMGALKPIVQHVSLLEALQELHDWEESIYNEVGEDAMHSRWDSTIEMRAALSRVADNHQLDASILETLKFEDR